MSRRIVVVVVCLLLAFIVAGLLIPYLLKARLNANLLASQNNLRQLAFFAAHHANPDPTRDASKLPKQIPAATVLLPGVPPENRLSWVVHVLPGVDQKRHPTGQLLTRLDPAQDRKSVV